MGNSDTDWDVAGANENSDDNSVIFDLADIKDEIHALDNDVRVDESALTTAVPNDEDFTIDLASFDTDVSDIIADYNNPDFIDLSELLDAAAPEAEAGAANAPTAEESAVLVESSDAETGFVTVAEVVFDASTTPLDIVFNMLDDTSSGSDV